MFDGLFSRASIRAFFPAAGAATIALAILACALGYALFAAYAEWERATSDVFAAVQEGGGEETAARYADETANIRLRINLLFAAFAAALALSLLKN